MATSAPAGEAYCFGQLSRGLQALVEGAPADGKVTLIDTIPKGGHPAWLAAQAAPVKAWAAATGFSGKDGEVCVVPSAEGGIERVVVVLEDATDLWAYAALPGKLPAGTYALGAGAQADAAALGWALGTYSFDRYKSSKSGEEGVAPKALLQWPEGAARNTVAATAEAIFLARDMITTPAEDMGARRRRRRRYCQVAAACNNARPSERRAHSSTTRPLPRSALCSAPGHCRRGGAAGGRPRRLLPRHRGRRPADRGLPRGAHGGPRLHQPAAADRPAVGAGGRRRRLAPARHPGGQGRLLRHGRPRPEARQRHEGARRPAAPATETHAPDARLVTPHCPPPRATSSSTRPCLTASPLDVCPPPLPRRLCSS
jgi:hypothetical protein